MTNNTKPKLKYPKAVWPRIPNILNDFKHNRIYKRGNLIGEGGFSKCYMIEDTYSKIKYACKVLLKSNIDSEKKKERLRNEFQVMLKLKHPNIIQYSSCFQDANFIFIVLELGSLGTLRDLIKKRNSFNKEDLFQLISSLICSLEYIHSQNIIHRDLKPSNIFISKKGTLKIGDFGLSAQCKDINERRNSLCGTTDYKAPEMKAGKHYSFKLDIWSLGAVIFYMIFRKPPTYKEENSTLQLNFPVHPRIEANLKELIENLLKVNPDDRPDWEAIKKFSYLEKMTESTSSKRRSPEYFTNNRSIKHLKVER